MRSRHSGRESPLLQLLLCDSSSSEGQAPRWFAPQPGAEQQADGPGMLWVTGRLQWWFWSTSPLSSRPGASVTSLGSNGAGQLFCQKQVKGGCGISCDSFCVNEDSCGHWFYRVD